MLFYFILFYFILKCSFFSQRVKRQIFIFMPCIIMNNKDLFVYFTWFDLIWFDYLIWMLTSNWSPRSTSRATLSWNLEIQTVLTSSSLAYSTGWENSETRRVASPALSGTPLDRQKRESCGLMRGVAGGQRQLFWIRTAGSVPEYTSCISLLAMQ